MKVTVEFDDRLYRRLKAEAALRGRSMKDMVAEGVRQVLAQPPDKQSRATADSRRPEGFGKLRRYAGNAGGRHDLAAMRGSIARGRSGRAP